MTAARNFQRLFEASRDGILLTTTDGDIIDANPAARQLLGYDQEEIFGMSATQLLAPSERPGPFPPKAISEGGNVDVEVRLATKDGGKVIASMSVTACRQASGEPALLCVIDDRTREHQLTRDLLELQEEERSRIGRDLHDSVGSQLTGAVVYLDQCIKRLTQGDQTSPDQLRQIRENIADTAEQIRHISHGLDPMRMGPTFLTPALEQLTHRIAAEGGITGRFKGPSAEPDIAAEVATHLYRIAQEAASNTLRHSRASSIEICLEQTPANLILELRDDGKGFNPEAPKARGLGCRSMRHRAELIGAEFEISSRPGQGTTIRCHVPRGETKA